MALLQTKKETTKGRNVSDVGTIDQRVAHFASLLNSNEGFSEDIQVLAEENQRQKRSAFLILWDMRDTLGDEIDSLPVPGSVKGQVNNYDLYPKDPSKEMKGPNKGSFYNDLFDLLSFGAAIKSEMAKIKEDQTISDVEREERLGVLKDRQTYGRSRVMKAAALHFQLKAIKELESDGIYLAELVTVEKDEDGDDVIVPRDGNKPFRLDDKATVENEFRRLSVEQVLNLEPDKALKKFREANGKVSMFKCLLSTLNSEKDTSATPGQNAPAIATVTAFCDYIAEMVAFSKKTHENAAIGASWRKELMKPENADLRENVATAAAFFNDLAENKDFARMYSADRRGANGVEEEKEEATA